MPEERGSRMEGKKKGNCRRRRRQRRKDEVTQEEPYEVTRRKNEDRCGQREGQRGQNEDTGRPQTADRQVTEETGIGGGGYNGKKGR